MLFQQPQAGTGNARARDVEERGQRVRDVSFFRQDIHAFRGQIRDTGGECGTMQSDSDGGAEQQPFQQVFLEFFLFMVSLLVGFAIITDLLSADYEE